MGTAIRMWSSSGSKGCCVGTTSGGGVVIYGMATGNPAAPVAGTWAATSTINAYAVDGTNGFQLYSSDLTQLPPNADSEQFQGRRRFQQGRL